MHQLLSYKAATNPTIPAAIPAPTPCTFNISAAADLVVPAAAPEVPLAAGALVIVPMDMVSPAVIEPMDMVAAAVPLEAAVEAHVAVVGRALAASSEPQIALANWIVAVEREEVLVVL